MIKFGPSGNSQKFYDEGNNKTEQSAKWVKDLDLDCFEYSFGRGVNLSDEKAQSLQNVFNNYGVEISVHAPYYVNLANESEEMVAKSFDYIINSAKKVKLMGGNRVVYHPASQGKLDREFAVNLTIERHKKLADLIYKNNLEDIYFCPETMGKLGQIGTIEEIAKFCNVDKVFIPTIDFGHVNAREQGSLNTEEDYSSRLEYLINEIGLDKMKNFHVHFSKIEYSLKGEVRHLTFTDEIFGPNFLPLAKVLKKLDLEPYIICESAGTQDVDAQSMKKIYFSL